MWVKNAVPRTPLALVGVPNEIPDRPERFVAVRILFSDAAFQSLKEPNQIVAQPREVTFDDFLGVAHLNVLPPTSAREIS